MTTRLEIAKETDLIIEKATIELLQMVKRNQELIKLANKKLANGDIEAIRLLDEVQENLSLINDQEDLIKNYKKNMQLILQGV